MNKIMGDKLVNLANIVQVRLWHTNEDIRGRWAFEFRRKGYYIDIELPNTSTVSCWYETKEKRDEDFNSLNGTDSVPTHFPAHVTNNVIVEKDNTHLGSKSSIFPSVIAGGALGMLLGNMMSD